MHEEFRLDSGSWLKTNWVLMTQSPEFASSSQGNDRLAYRRLRLQFNKAVPDILTCPERWIFLTGKMAKDSSMEFGGGRVPVQFVFECSPIHKASACTRFPEPGSVGSFFSYCCPASSENEPDELHFRGGPSSERSVMDCAGRLNPDCTLFPCF